MKSISSIALVAICTALLSCGNAKLANYQVIPLPQSITMNDAVGSFSLNKNTTITYPDNDSALLNDANFLGEYVKDMTGLELAVLPASKAPAKNVITLDATADSASIGSASEEGYNLIVTPDAVTINGASAAGTFYGVQTLRKSLPAEKGNVEMPAVVIADYPRFAYRGAHLDVCRHFFPVDSVKRFIDMIALHNVNNMHWHITEDQGWRIEIKKYPKLTEVGSLREGTCIGRDLDTCDSIPYGGFYTQDEARDIVKYAAERHINVIPEIDLPGHMQGALAAYPQLGCTGGPYKVWPRWGISPDVLCAGNDSVITFLGDVLDEIADIFPSKYIHIGGDECPKARWKQCPKCQAKIKKLGLKSDGKHSAEDYLQSYIMQFAESHLALRGRKIIGWDEILQGEVGPTATVHSWRGAAYGAQAARLGHDAIMSPNSYLYFDYDQVENHEDSLLSIGGYIPVSKVYSFEPIDSTLTPEEAKHIIGVQPNLWTEYIADFWRVEYNELPRLAAACEVQWTLPEKKDYKSFLTRVAHQLDIYDIYNYHYAKHIYNVSASYVPNTTDKCMDVTLSTIDDAPVYYTIDGSEPTEKSTRYTEPLALTDNCIFKAKAIRKNSTSRTVSEILSISKNTFKPATLLSEPNQRYKSTGANVLCDGLVGSESFATGRWLGYVGNDLIAVFDLEEPTEISDVNVQTLVLPRDWIFNAREITIEVSEDGENYTQVSHAAFPVQTKEAATGIINHKLLFNKVAARYVKVTVVSERSIPEWHTGKGGWGYLFVDEVSIN